MNRSLLDTQMNLEEESLGLGRDRYNEQKDKDVTKVRPGKRLLVESFGQFKEVLKKWMEETKSQDVRRNLSLIYFLEDVDSLGIITYVTVRSVIYGMTKRQTLQTVAKSISMQLEDTINHAKLKEEAPKLYKKLIKKIETSSHAGYRHTVLRKQMKFAEVRTTQWDTSTRVRLGLHLIDLMKQSVFLNGSPLFSLSSEQAQSCIILQPTPTTFEWLRKSHEHCELLEPVFLPMVVEPKPWTTPVSGGYLHPKLQRPLVKAKGRQGYIEELHHADLSRVYSAVNALQSTPWSINSFILSVMQQVWESGDTLGGLPSANLLEIPARCSEDAPKEVIKERNAIAARIYEENIKQESKRLAMDAKLSIGRKFKDFEAIYFVHTLDWRGRAYPSASYVNPQGDDSGKALLQFANGCPLGEDGAYWLAVHGANSYGIDKVSFDERVQWVLDNEDKIMESALNPINGSQFWAVDQDGEDTESPYVFLAFCKEWLGFVMSGRSNDYISHLPVALDGSCNGLQNYSMMLRDEIGGAATNLIPSEKPSDIYTMVAEKAQEIVNEDIKKGVFEAKAWQGKVVRKVAKQPTMTMPYGSGLYGYKEQILTTVKKLTKKSKGVPYLGTNDPYMASMYLAKQMDVAIRSIVVKAAEAMDWLKEVAKVVASEGLPIRWTTPSGFPVLQDYRESVGEVLKATISGIRLRLTLTRETDIISKRKQTQGIAPNFVHSCDASHMMQTVNSCLLRGIQSFAMIHDSYGTHAGNAEILAYELRKSFVEMYSGDVLEKFRDELLEQLSDELKERIPELPLKGTLNPDLVMDSVYFFA